MHPLKPDHTTNGFTLTEIMVTIAIFTTVIAGASVTFIMGLRAYQCSAGETDAANAASLAIARIAYGTGDNCGLRAAFAPVSALSGNNGWRISFNVPSGPSGDAIQVSTIRYDKSNKIIQYRPTTSAEWTTIGKNIIDSTIRTGSKSISITVKAIAIIGDNRITNTKTTTIAFRN